VFADVAGEFVAEAIDVDVDGIKGHESKQKLGRLPRVRAVGVTWLYGFDFEIKIVAKLPLND
jgi:hypothetical protein